MVFHTGFVPLIPQEGYKEWFKNCLASFKVLTQESQKQGVRLLVENFWEPYPEMIYDLIKKTRSGILKFCFDLGHFNIYSKAPLSQWLRLLAPETLSLHLHDNDGVSDEHLALGSGRVKFKEVIKKFLKEGVQPYINLEVKPKFISSSLKFIFEEKLLSE
jgi:sugar phosphate isomerase/epimerase